MFRKRKKLLEDFKVIFKGYSPEEQVDLGGALMLDVYLRNPDRLNRAMMEVTISRMVKRTEELLAQAKAADEMMIELKPKESE